VVKALEIVMDCQQVVQELVVVALVEAVTELAVAAWVAVA
jgi:hypothetical protein